MPSPNVACDKARLDSKPQDKSGGLGYNRDLIGAAQALRIDSAPSNRSQPQSRIAQRAGAEVAGHRV
jgi:hypothetical protein